MKRIYSASDLPSTIPIFPLSGALVLPRAQLPLNIFEPRYLQMVEDALKTEHRLIGMVQEREVPANMGDAPLHQIGCAGRITSFTETESGRYLISLKGISRYRISECLDESAPYLQANVDWTDFSRDLGGEEDDESFNRPRFLAQLELYFEANELQTDWDSLKDAGEELLINSLSIMCPFSSEERQALLESPCLKTRREMISTLIEFSMRSNHNDTGKMQ